MNEHRLVDGTDLKVKSAGSPFSCFEFVENAFPNSAQFPDPEAIKRCFSLARTFDLHALTIEQIPAVGMIKEENEEITALGHQHSMGALVRVGFWEKDIAPSGPDSAQDGFIGYAIFKRDDFVLDGNAASYWHVFEAMFPKYVHEHNFVPNHKSRSVKIGCHVFEATGVLFCQQNTLNKCCAHVAMRSVLARRLPEGDVSYNTLNELARNCPDTTTGWQPNEGLNPKQMQFILRSLNIPFRDIDYSEEEQTNLNVRSELLYQKYVYAGVESGAGALLGFHMDGPGACDGRHIIPFFGHTFNKDTWVPNADESYLNIGGSVGYIPSENWTSSFIGHDDNFGPNFCVPRLYVKPEQVDYVVELLPDGYDFSGMQAEAATLPFIYSMLQNLISSGNTSNPWIKRLAEYESEQRIVLRAVALSCKAYIDHLSDLTDWNDNAEEQKVLEFLRTYLPPALWVVEFSVPHLFPANERKMGEIVLSSSRPLEFSLARFPETYYFADGEENGVPKFNCIDSALVSHTELVHY